MMTVHSMSVRYSAIRRRSTTRSKLIAILRAPFDAMRNRSIVAQNYFAAK